jgi:uncharacterized protein YcfJ
MADPSHSPEHGHGPATQGATAAAGALGGGYCGLQVLPDGQIIGRVALHCTNGVAQVGG